MEVYILVDWKVKHIVGVYTSYHETLIDKNRFIDSSQLEIIKRDLIC